MRFWSSQEGEERKQRVLYAAVLLQSTLGIIFGALVPAYFPILSHSASSSIPTKFQLRNNGKGSDESLIKQIAQNLEKRQNLSERDMETLFSVGL